MTDDQPYRGYAGTGRPLHEAIAVQTGTALRGMYDDDRCIAVESSINGELSIRIGNEEPIFVFAEDFRDLVAEQVRLSLLALQPSQPDLGTGEVSS